MATSKVVSLKGKSKQAAPAVSQNPLIADSVADTLHNLTNVVDFLHQAIGHGVLEGDRGVADGAAQLMNCVRVAIEHAALQAREERAEVSHG